MDIQQNTQTQNNEYINNSQTDNYSNVIEKIVDCANDHLLMLMNQMLTSADKKLIEQADKKSSDIERAKFMNCTQVFRTKNNDIANLFFLKLNNALTISPSDNNDETSLVDQDEMDEMVAITTMHSKAMNVYGAEVNHLETRIEYLEIMGEDIFDKEALDPKHICEIFQLTIENIDLAIEAKLIFYKLFDQEVCSKLAVMYKALNKIFIDNDIMPEIMMNTTKDNEVEFIQAEVSSRVATYYDPEDNIHTDFVPRTKAEISRIVNEFMAGDMTITGDEIDLPESFLRAPTQQDLDGKDCYERKEVVKALSKLQYKLISLQKSSEPLTTKQIKKELLEDIRLDNTESVDKKVNLLDERSIDFVGMMFDAITGDNTISEIITNLIKRLQIPVMKIAMSDSSLFSNEEHSARVIVNLLATAGRGINTEKDRLFKNLEAIVDNILNEYDTDIAVFDNAALVLRGIIDAEEHAANNVEKQQQKQIIQDHARKIVTTQYKIVARNKKIPNNIRPLILKNWSTLMLNRYLRFGRGSSQWTQSVSLLKLLLKCMQPIKFQSQYTMISNNHVVLAESVDDELSQTKQNKQDISSQLTLLKSHFTTIIDDCDFQEIVGNEKQLTDNELDLDDDEAELLEIKQQVEKAEQKLSMLASNTKPGAWYEIYTGEDKALRRLKLSIILNDAARLIFVDRKGVKVIEKDADEFARELADNRSRIIADHSTFDHALGMVIGAIAA
ncbi:MAG: DUF1631 family protein [Gammaproteobacteria bacterium]|nr:DUF1631 family protein [Gammaproteobacteria bacterium]